MRNTLAKALLLSTILLSPFLTCDPQEGVTHHEITGAPWVAAGTVVKSPAKEGSTVLWLDLKDVPVNSTSELLVKACNEYWGCSESSPFVLKRPAQSLPLKGLRLDIGQ